MFSEAHSHIVNRLSVWNLLHDFSIENFWKILFNPPNSVAIVIVNSNGQKTDQKLYRFKTEGIPSETQTRIFFQHSLLFILIITISLKIYWISGHIFYLNIYFIWALILSEHMFYLNIYFIWKFILSERMFYLNIYFTWTYI